MRRTILLGSITAAWAAAFTYLGVVSQVPQAPVFGTTETMEAAGHFLATVCLAALLSALLATTGSRGPYRSASIAMALTLALALAIEAIQWFRPGRGVDAIDIVLDACGALIGTAAYIGLSRRWSVEVVSRTVMAGGVFAIVMTAGVVLTQSPVPRHRCRGDEASSPITAAEANGEGSRVEDSLLAEYRFEEGAGGVATASTGSATSLDLVLEHEVSWLHAGGVGIGGPAGLLRSREAAGEISVSILRSGSFTIEAWVTPDREQGGPARIVSISNGTDLAEIDVQIAQEETCLSHRVRFDEVTEWVVVEGAFAGAATRHVVFTFSAGASNSFVNGQLIDSHAAFEDEPTDWNPDHHLLIGNEEGGGRAFEGEVLLVAVYDRALTEAEVLRNYRAGAHPTG